jgi:hypothetical protein
MAQKYIRKWGCGANDWHELKKNRKTMTKCGRKITDGKVIDEEEFKSMPNRYYCHRCRETV